MGYGYKLMVYKADRRTKIGERLVKSYEYKGYSGNAMMDEIFDLKQRLYKPADGWRLDFVLLFPPAPSTAKDLTVE